MSPPPPAPSRIPTPSPSLALRPVGEIVPTEEHLPAPTSPPSPFLAALISALLVATLIGAVVFLTQRPDPAPIVLQPPPTPGPTPTPLPTATPVPIVVFVTGAVESPGLYTLPVGARVADALTESGGFTDEADALLVNQAEPLWDGAQLFVPALVMEESVEATAAEPTVQQSVQPVAGLASTSSLAPLGDGRAGPAPSGATGGLVNVNTAGVAELQSLPGIGPAKAASIIGARPFASIEDLERVSGIGPATVEKLRPLVTIR